MHRALAFASFALPLLCLACSGEDAPEGGATGGGATGGTSPATPAPAAKSAVEVDLTLVQSMFKADPPEQGRNRATADKVALGRMLYHDVRLSKNGDVSCASCHDLSNWGQDGKPVSMGSGGVATERNAPTVFNAFRQFAQFWDFRADTVEQAVMPSGNGSGHGLAGEAEVVSALEGIPEYAEPFAKAFPRDEKPITAENVRLAIGAFLRKLRTRSRWDAFVEGDESVLTDDEKRGLVAFMESGCTTCHLTRLLGGNQQQKLGLIRPVEAEDKGRFEFTQKAGDEYQFKVPSLLNVAKTAPYGHDGHLATLEDAIRYMVKHQVAQPVSDSQVKAIASFLGALTGELEDKSVLAENK